MGDIDIEDHRKWEEMECRQAGIEAYLPLWQRPRLELLKELFNLGYRVVIVFTQDEKLGSGYLGEHLTPKLIATFERLGIDPCGENGEYHTVIVGGPV